MKLPNGFGSHRYVYSPILLDSQVANSFYLPALQLLLVTLPVLTLYYLKRLASANGMEATSVPEVLLAAAGAACIPYTTTVDWLPAMEWRWSSSCHAWCAAYQDP